jgi:hypothetical protein
MNMRYRNAMQRDPNLAKAFDNLAGLFAPPSGSDFLASAKMQSERADAARRDWLFNNSADPTASARSSLQGYQGFGQTPVGFGMTDTTNRRGQDISAKTEIEKTQLQQAGELARQYAKPVILGQGQSGFIPAQTQAATGFRPVLQGTQELDRGKAYDRPDGAGGMTRVMGPAMPRTMDEAKASVFDQMSPRERNAIVFGSTPIEQVIMGDRATNVTRPESLDQSPVASKKLKEVVTDERGAQINIWEDGTATYADGTPVDPRTRQVERARPQGPNDQLGITNSNRTDVNNLQAAVDGARFTVQNMRKILAENPNVAGIPGRVKGVLQSLASSAQQSFKAYADQAPDAKITLGEARDLLNRAAGGYDPNIVRLQSGIMDLAYARAQIANPRGEVSRQAFERALESFGQTLLSSQQDLETGLAAFEQDSLGAADVKIQSLRRGSGGQPGAPAAPAATPPASAGAQGDPLAQAREAIARGASREAVIQRLRQNGVDPGGL